MVKSGREREVKIDRRTYGQTDRWTGSQMDRDRGRGSGIEIDKSFGSD